MRLAIAALVLLALPVVGFAEEGPAPARIRHVEGDVTLQRATEASAEPAVPNLIWLGGDRLWTAAGGRAELELPDGSLIHLATASKLDLIGYDGEAAALRLWAGSLSLWVPAARERPDVVIETPDAVVSVRQPGLYRIDAITGETRLSVVRGAASLESGGETLALADGERSWARYGEPPDPPEYFDAQTADAFDTWVDARLRRSRHVVPAGVPAEIEPWAGELSEYGDWSVVPEVGTVWRPRAVAVGWQPYQLGHWGWSPWGWTWISTEPWGWAPYHYGRWGFSVSLGWYWSPGRVWGGAWVSWSIGGGYVGWCPLGLRGGPVFPHHRYGRGSRGWLYVHSRGLGARHLGRYRVSYTHLRGAHLTHLGRGYQPGRRGVRSVARRAIPRTDRGAFGRLDRHVARPFGRGDGDGWRSSTRSRGAGAVPRDRLRDPRPDARRLDAPTRERGGDRLRSGDPARDRRPAARPRTPTRDRSRSAVAPRSRPATRSRSSAHDRTRSLDVPRQNRPATRSGEAPRDRSRPAAQPRSERSQPAVAPRSRPATRSRSNAPDRSRSFDTRRQNRPATRSGEAPRDRSRPAAQPRSERSRPAVAPRSRPATRSRSSAPDRSRSFETRRQSRPATRSGEAPRDRSRPAVRPRSDRSRSGVAPRSQPATRSRSRPSQRTRSNAPQRQNRPATRSGGASRDRSRPATRGRDGGSRSGAAPRGGRSRSRERRQRQR